MKRGPEFVAFLKTMSQMPPLKQVSPEEHLAAFRAAFGNDLAKMDKAVGEYLSKLKGYDPSALLRRHVRAAPERRHGQARRHRQPVGRR